MFKEIIAALKKHNQLTECLGLFDQMSENNLWMFQASFEALDEPTKQAALRDEIYHRDVLVNRAERSIRKKIVLHLSSSNVKDTPFCLILMSAVKDAERIGDYCKNFFQAAGLFKGCDKDDPYMIEIKSIGDSVQKTFNNTAKAFHDSDQALGRDMMHVERDIAERCDAMINKLALAEGLDTNKAVCFTLFFRFLKRISAHLGNIASTVVMPLHKIDYYDEPSFRKSRQED